MPQIWTTSCHATVVWVLVGMITVDTFTARHLHKSTQHVNSCMCDTIVVSLQCLNNLDTKFISEPRVKTALFQIREGWLVNDSTKADS